MEFIITTILLGLTIVLLLALLFRKSKATENDNAIATLISDKNRKDIEHLLNELEKTNKMQNELIKLYNDSVLASINLLIDKNNKNLSIIADKLNDLSQNNERQMDKLILETRENLTRLNQTNSEKLDEMRVIVDDKLNATLTDRLNSSFKIVSEQLLEVTKGLGEMQTLASGVGDLKKVLTNVKTRGTLGEVQLGVLLEQMLSPNQYAEQVMLKEGSTERVDFAIKFPGKDDKETYLPIDAKFPMEDYLRLVDASNSGDLEQVASCEAKLVKRIKEEAKSIKEKYIQVPKTTDFAVMYLPTEGLYAEVIRQEGLFELLQRDYKITVCGPTTLSALLNSLQMGFRSLAIEKRSSEIYSMLSLFKKEFNTYVELLSKTQKKLTEATDTIESATKKSQKIQKQLDKVDFDDGSDLIGQD